MRLLIFGVARRMEATKYLVHGDFELSIPGAGAARARARARKRCIVGAATGWISGRSGAHASFSPCPRHFGVVPASSSEGSRGS